jgi:uncharacterized protein (UPF0548 family)
MFFPTRPSGRQIDDFLAAVNRSELSYEPVGLSSLLSATGFNVDAQRVPVGRGRAAFEVAVTALMSWRMFPDWTEVHPKNALAQEGLTVGVLARHLGFWSLNACRVVQCVEEADRRGFAYGTLQDHAERGEERFVVELDAHTEVVWYELRAVSRPRAAAWLGYPVSRWLQARFRSDSATCLARAVDEAQQVTHGL